MGRIGDGLHTVHAGGGLSASRRAILVGGAAAAIATSLSVGGPLSEALAADGYDPFQRYLTLVGIGQGQILAVQADGKLLWHRNASWANATGDWTSGSGRVIGSDWHQYRWLTGSADGSIYAVRGDGTLLRHRYQVRDLETGEGSWDRAERIASGWNQFTEVVGFGGDFYGRAPSGEIYWSHYDPAKRRWTVVRRRLRGFNFKGHALFADADGVLYSHSGVLYWHRQVGGVWQRGSGSPLSPSLGDLTLQGIHATGAGSFYYLRPDAPGSAMQGQLLVQRLTNWRHPRPAPLWANGGTPTPVGTGWWIEPWAALQGYPLTRSVAAGRPAEIAVSTTFAEISWTLLEVGGERPVEVSPARRGRVRGHLQSLPGPYHLSTGCRWKPAISVSTAGLSSGLYAVRLSGPHGLTRDIPFIVHPARQTSARIAFLIPTLTHHAYNTWGGHSQYCDDLNGQQRFISLERPSRTSPIEPTGRLEHTLYSDVMLLQWMKREGYAVDVYDDLDLHRDPGLLQHYDIVVLPTHSEYWSLPMRQGLADYLGGGGNLIYAGANGIFEAVDIDSAATVVTYRFSDEDATKARAATGAPVSVGSRRLMSLLGYPSSLLVGVAYRSLIRPAPYRVKARTGHPLLAGTGLVQGSTFGSKGYNGPASGWEADAVLPGWPGQATREDVIASGANPRGGADMIYRPTGHGGAVFSASSITFVGSLAYDTAMSRLFKNVFDSMLAAAATYPRTIVNQPMQMVAPTAPTSQLNENH